MSLTYFATAPKGLEQILANELTSLGASSVSIGVGGVHFKGGVEVGYKANLWLRTAIRVLMRLRSFKANSPEALYDGVQTIDWSEFMSKDQTLAISANVRDSELTHSHYVALKTKDAIVDQFREKTGERPSIDKQTPDLSINVHIKQNKCILSLDMSGASLHKRGYRLRGGKAPLSEALAAGILQLAGYDGQKPLHDLMCGSGTFAIEAALMKHNIAPGLLRPSFGFQRWHSFDKSIWKELSVQARRSIIGPADPTIFASDISDQALKIAGENADRAGVLDYILFQRTDFRKIAAPEKPGMVICNPPYGERLGELPRLRELYKDLGDHYKKVFRGHLGCIFTGNLELIKKVGLKPKNRHVLYNGPLESRLVVYELY